MASLYVKTALWLTMCSNQPKKPPTIYSHQSRKADYYLYYQSRKLNNNPLSTQPQITRTSLITGSFSNICPHFQFRVNQIKPTM